MNYICSLAAGSRSCASFIPLLPPATRSCDLAVPPMLTDRPRCRRGDKFKRTSPRLSAVSRRRYSLRALHALPHPIPDNESRHKRTADERRATASKSSRMPNTKNTWLCTSSQLLRLRPSLPVPGRNTCSVGLVAVGLVSSCKATIGRIKHERLGEEFHPLLPISSRQWELWN